MFYKPKIILVLYISILTKIISSEGFCELEDPYCNSPTARYIFYDVNRPEGFNLRRDVYIRFALLVHKLTRSKNENLKHFKLVLPPWSMLYHWKSVEEPEQIPWGRFFDIESMQKFVPVIDMYKFFEEYKNAKYGKMNIDKVYILQHFQDMFTSGNFIEKYSEENCTHPIETNFYYYHNVTSKDIRCMSFHGFASQLQDILQNTDVTTIMFDHGEVALQDGFGNKLYWQCRRSMRFNKDLVYIAQEFRRKFLNSTDVEDGTLLPVNWQDEKPRRSAKGGPYIGVHLRRKDFLWGRAKHVPNLKNAAIQIKQNLKKLKLNTVFIATDAPDKEFQELKLHIGSNTNVFKFKANKEIKKEFKDGGIAIIDQIICSHARHFIGTYESTFSFRIQEEREIIGFPTKSTFNRLCGDEEGKCEGSTVWKIQY